MSSYTRQQLESWINTIIIKSNCRVLDIGGSQKPVQKRLRESGENTIYETLDLEVPHEGEKPDIVWDINEKLPTDRMFEQYDVVFCLEVMEYVWNPVQALNNMRRFLKQDGTLFISTPFLYPVHNPVDQDYLRYTPNGIKKLLKETGFEVLDDEPRVLKHKNVWIGLSDLEGMKPSREYQGHDIVGSLITAKK